MPELPDVTVYVDRIRAIFGKQRLTELQVVSPLVLRTYDPPAAEFRGKELVSASRVGKRIVLEFEDDLFAVVHLMVAGRFKLRARSEALSRKLSLCAFDFGERRLLLTEASKKKRASLHLLRGVDAVRSLDRGGIEPLGCSLQEFAVALRRENRTLKRALTDPSIFSGIGNAYSDEILFWARLSPVQRTRSLTDEECERLYVATRQTLIEWTARLTREVGDRFPEKVTAFREEMAVHGKFKAPCKMCGTAIQRIAYAENEVNYCPRCQTGGRVLADRALSRLLKSDWPRRIEDLEEGRPGAARVRSSGSVEGSGGKHGAAGPGQP